jgi:hypothetical protein
MSLSRPIMIRDAPTRIFRFNGLTERLRGATDNYWDETSSSLRLVLIRSSFDCDIYP